MSNKLLVVLGLILAGLALPLLGSLASRRKSPGAAERRRLESRRLGSLLRSAKGPADVLALPSRLVC